MALLAEELVRAKACINGLWVISKPLPGPLLARIKDAWRVVKGEAEAVLFMEGGGWPPVRNLPPPPAPPPNSNFGTALRDMRPRGAGPGRGVELTGYQPKGGGPMGKPPSGGSNVTSPSRSA